MISPLQLTFSDLKQYMTKLDKTGIKQSHLVCTFIIWCLFSSLIKCSETSLGAVVILPLIVISQLQLTFSELKQVIHDQTRQNGYQIVPFSVHIHNLMFVFILEWLFWKESRYRCYFTTNAYQLLSYIANVFWLETANTWPNWTKWVSNSSI